MIWKQTVRVGCGQTYCRNMRGYYYVCNYYPPGNYIGEFVRNVNPLSYYNDDENQGVWDEEEEEEENDESS